jgi:hypothetical protein
LLFSADSKSWLPTWRNGLFCNPEGIASLSPALARLREGLRWVVVSNVHTLKGLHIKDLAIFSLLFAVQFRFFIDNPGLRFSELSVSNMFS